LAGGLPGELARQFAADTFTLTTHELTGKYGIAESTLRDWRLFCKRNLELAVDYGVAAITFVNRKDGLGPVALL
jgi:hypothetical protein